MEYNYYPENYDINDYTLPSLSCDAAVELDNHRLGREREFVAVNRLAEILAEEVTKERMDPVFIVTLYKTQQEHSPKEIREVKDLVPQIRTRIEELVNARFLPKKKLKGLMYFCLDLTKQIHAYQDQYLTTRHHLAVA